MIPDQIDKNLLLLLDPSCEADVESWHFIPWDEHCGSSSSVWRVNSQSTGTIYSFTRRELLGYLVFSWLAKKQGLLGKPSKYLYINDGILASIFSADSKTAYADFTASFLPQAKGLKRRLISFLPPLLRADKRYVFVAANNYKHSEINRADNNMLNKQDFMFFSNASGKLLLITSETLSSGKGFLFKSTANQNYAEVMENEFKIMNSITEQGRSGCLPQAGKRIICKKRIFFEEEYVQGDNLRKVLHWLGRKRGVVGICGYLDRLDEWFQEYVVTFQGERRTLTSCYRHLFNAFFELYGADPRVSNAAQMAGLILKNIDTTFGGVVTGTAHNDLWPGNFVVKKNRLVAVDWERAAVHRAPLFDYYWMIISAALEYYVCLIGRSDYSQAFRLFLSGTDEVALHSKRKLKSFLGQLALDENLYKHFLLLFMMEWSVQGYLALSSQSAMDKLAFEELVKCLESNYFNDEICRI